MRDDEGKTVLTIELVVGLVIVGVQPLTIVVAIRVEKVRIAIRIARNIAETTTH